MSARKCKEKIGSSLYQRLRKEYGLKIKDIKFIIEYVTNGFNKTEAWMQSFARKGKERQTSRESAGQQASVYLSKNIKVHQAIEEIFNEWIGEKKLKLENEIIDTLYKRAFYNAFLFVNPDGSLKYKTEEELKANVPEEWWCVVDGVETKYYGRDAIRKVTVLKLANREKAIVDLGTYINMFKEAGTVPISLTEDTVKTLKDVFDSRNK